MGIATATESSSLAPSTITSSPCSALPGRTCVMCHRHVQLGACGLSFSVYQSERLARGVLFDLAVDPAGGRAVAVGQDGQVRLFDVATGRAIRNFSAAADCGELGGVPGTNT